MSEVRESLVRRAVEIDREISKLYRAYRNGELTVVNDLDHCERLLQNTVYEMTDAELKSFKSLID